MIKSNKISNEKWNNILVVLIVALFLTIYELLMYYVKVIPDVRLQINNFINNIDISSNNPIMNKIANIVKADTGFLDLLKTFEEREKILTSKINKYTILVGLILLFGLIALILYINFKYHAINSYVILVSSITIMLLLVFQYIFYNYGIRYNYRSTFSSDELLHFVINKL